MSDDRTAVAEAVTAILTDLSTSAAVRRTEDAGWNEELWSVLSESGFTLISVPEKAGGSGGDLADACAVLGAVGRFAAAVPIAEHAVMAGWALASADLEIPAGAPVTAATGDPRDETMLERTSNGWRVSGRWHRVPWARQSQRLVVLAPHEDGHVVLSLPTAELNLDHATNLAGESRDTATTDGLVVEGAVAPPHVTTEQLRLRGALARATTTAGALRAMSDLTIRYTAEREQFGRALVRFQAVQRHIVRLVERAQMAHVAAECAALNAIPDVDFFDGAAAKVVAGESATIGAQAAHQAHGAIGMTKEYDLGQFSRRVWSWRDEFGGEAHWSRLLGERLAESGADEFWPRLSLGLHAEQSLVTDQNA